MGVLSNQTIVTCHCLLSSWIHSRHPASVDQHLNALHQWHRGLDEVQSNAASFHKYRFCLMPGLTQVGEIRLEPCRLMVLTLLSRERDPTIFSIDLFKWRRRLLNQKDPGLWSPVTFKGQEPPTSAKFDLEPKWLLQYHIGMLSKDQCN